MACIRAQNQTWWTKPFIRVVILLHGLVRFVSVARKTKRYLLIALLDVLF